MCLVVLLLPPEGALGEGLQVQQPRRPRAAYWLTTFSQLNKYIEKLFNGRWVAGGRQSVEGREGVGNGRHPPPPHTHGSPMTSAKMCFPA